MLMMRHGHGTMSAVQDEFSADNLASCQRHSQLKGAWQLGDFKRVRESTTRS